MNRQILHRAVFAGLIHWVFVTACWPQPKSIGPVGEIRIADFSLHSATMEEALLQLRRYDRTQILIAFEKLVAAKGREEPRFSVKLQDKPIKEILRALCSLDARYECGILKDRILAVRPRAKYRAGPNLLGIRVDRYSANGNFAPDGLIKTISQMAPELNSFLRQKELGYDRKLGHPPRSSPGSRMMGNMNPEVHLELQRLTVFEILNEISIYSLKQFSERPPDASGFKVPPCSWKYEFVVDPGANTGLGGYPIWTPFN